MMPRRRMLLVIRVLLGTVFGLAVGALLLAWSGLYNIAASRGHWPIVEWFLAFGMRNSVELRARFVEAPPPLDDPNLYMLGAAHFHSGCAICHGAPGIPISAITKNMLPPPPDLSVATREWDDRELFWIVKNGIKYTGMPAWPSQQRDDEVWAVVAFLKRLPEIDAQRYREWALGGLPVDAPSGREIATEDAATATVSACARCHGADGGSPTSALVPVLHGQPQQFLAAALQMYATAVRASGIMQPVATDLSAEAAQRVSEFYAGLSPPARQPDTSPNNALAIERGRSIANEGVPAELIPPCIGCHGAEALPNYPRLAGQNAPYMIGRLRRWRDGQHSGTVTGAIMAPIARRLTDEQIADVSAYFSALPGQAESGALRR